MYCYIYVLKNQYPFFMNRTTYSVEMVRAFLEQEGFVHSGSIPFSKLERWKRPGVWLQSVFLPSSPCPELSMFKIRSLFRNKALADRFEQTMNLK